MKIKRIAIGKIFDSKEFKELANEYWTEAQTLNIQAKPSRELYEILERGGRLKSAGLFTDSDKLAGFVVIVITPHLHYSIEIAHVDSLWLSKDYRKGQHGLKLLKEAEAIAREFGCPVINFSCPAGSRQEKLFEKLYRRADVSFVKNLI